MFHAAFLKKTFQLYEGNNQLNFLFYDQRFGQARSSENMARQVYLHGRPLVRCTFFGSFLPKKRSDHESQKSGFRFDLKNPLEVWILWIHDPFLDFSNKTQNPFLDSRIRIWIFPQKRALIERKTIVGLHVTSLNSKLKTPQAC